MLRYKSVSWTEAEVDGTLKGKPWRAKLPSVGRHMALNAAAAVLAAHCTGVPVQEAASALSHAVLPPMRMEVIELNGATIVLDNYNASPPSMAAAIETLSEIPARGRRLAIIGEMRELGPESAAGHKSVGEALGRSKVDGVLFYGDATKEAARSSGLAGVTFASSLADVTDFLRTVRAGDVVLIKGSRALELEKALAPLMEPVA